MEITLRKCAYIFDSTASNFRYGTREQIEKQRAIYNEMRTYYDNAEKRAEKIPASVDKYNRYCISVCGVDHVLNDLQIAHVYGESDNAINQRKVINASTLNVRDFDNTFITDNLYHKKLKSLNFEFFTEPESLGYIRVHFRNNCVEFIATRDGSLYTSGEHGKHAPINRQLIVEKLGAESAAARSAIYAVIDAIIAA